MFETFDSFEYEIHEGMVRVSQIWIDDKQDITNDSIVRLDTFYVCSRFGLI